MRWLLSLGLLAPSVGFAQTVTIDLDGPLVKKAGLDVDEINQGLNDAIADDLRLIDPPKYLGYMAEAAAMSMKGMGADYASNPKGIVGGLSFGTAVAGVPAGFARGQTDLPPGGYAAQLSLMGGVNLGMLVPGEDDFFDRVVIYANGMYLTPPTPEIFRGTFFNVGLHGQVKVIGPANAAVFEWGGLDLTAGIERGSYLLRLSKALPLNGDFGGATVRWRADGDYTLTAGSTSFPLELSTNLRLLVLTVYGGVALDINAGSSNSRASLSGPVEVDLDGEFQSLGNASVAVEADGSAANTTQRAFVGTQLNVFFFKVYGHLNVATNNSFGGHLGARVVL
ncbi:MAG: hypothetical protein KTR31_22190 [Myxococcales bacterium]|nr:hypothetical protein [Myxococcales bacterium]